MHDVATQAKQNLFRVVDAGAERTDLSLRREAKFVLHGTDAGKVRSVLAGNLKRQVHADRVSVVRSVYFDDAKLSACRANLSGIANRRKMRIRWYDSELPDSRFFFEIKWRKNRITGKRRWEIESSIPVPELSYRDITRGVCDFLDGTDLLDAWRCTEPIVLVEYRREHFVSDDGLFRFTLDFDVRFFDQTGRRKIRNAFGERLEHFTVLEAKFPPGYDAWLRDLLHPFSPRVGSSSKYVQGCRCLGFVGETE